MSRRWPWEGQGMCPYAPIMIQTLVIKIKVDHWQTKFDFSSYFTIPIIYPNDIFERVHIISIDIKMYYEALANGLIKLGISCTTLDDPVHVA